MQRQGPNITPISNLKPKQTRVHTTERPGVSHLGSVRLAYIKLKREIEYIIRDLTKGDRALLLNLRTTEVALNHYCQSSPLHHHPFNPKLPAPFEQNWRNQTKGKGQVGEGERPQGRPQKGE